MWLLVVLVVELVLIGTLAFDPRLTIAAVLGVAGALAVLEYPLLGVCVLIAARLLSTGATVFFRVGRMGIGPFEPALLLCLAALVFYVVFHRERLWRAWPWKTPFLALTAWVGLTALWSVSVKDTLGELIPLVLVLANTLVILAFVRSWSHFRWVLLAWIGSCIAIGLVAALTDGSSLTSSNAFQAASGGGRETGLGQQPNWFAMNLMFIIPTCFGLALVERKTWLRLGLAGAGAFIFYSMLQSGSRGGAYATLIGGMLVSLAHPVFRRWFLRLAAASAGVGVLIVASDLSGAAALTRITTNALTLRQSYRQWNWQVCVEMFQDTWGRGIGAGGYTDLLPEYHYYLSQSLYDYPHGIFWEFLAHYGVPGLVLLGWLVLAIIGMAGRLIQMTRGTVAEVVAWTMPAAMLGYLAWSFVEFTITEKPFWEFLAVYTALYLIAERARSGEGPPLPRWHNRPRVPWRQQAAGSADGPAGPAPTGGAA